jgi:hypothetical protein
MWLIRGYGISALIVFGSKVYFCSVQDTVWEAAMTGDGVLLEKCRAVATSEDFKHEQIYVSNFGHFLYTAGRNIDVVPVWRELYRSWHRSAAR